jgi:hypothetical protein
MLREKLVDLRIASAAATHSGMIDNPQRIYEETASEIKELLRS